MMDYRIQPHTRRCVVTGKELKPGEKFFTALVEENHQFVRRDYSIEAWQGPPVEAFSFWMGHVPRETDARPQIDEELLLDCFLRLEGQNEPRKVNFRYVVALLLMRQKRLKFVDAKISRGQEILVVQNARDKKRYEVINPQLSEPEIDNVQEEVFKVLGWEQ